MRSCLLLLLLLLAHAELAPSQCCQWPPTNHTLVDDMWLPDSVVIGDGAYTATPWTGGVVPYEWHPDVTTAQRDLFRRAMLEIEAVSQVRFVPYSSGSNRILIRENPVESNVSNSAVGMIGGQQVINVGSNHWTIKYVLVHEMMHALGFVHEQNRPDRDNYVSINFSNIEPGRENNFMIVGGATTVGVYDFLSIMHYSRNAFSINSQPTIQCNFAFQTFQNQIGNLSYMTALDAAAIAARYGAPSNPVVTSVTPNSAYAGGSNGVAIVVNGAHFFEGSPSSSGVQGSVVRFNQTVLQTSFVNENTLVALIPASFLQNPAPINDVRVQNDVKAGGTSATFANFAINVPPCGTLDDRLGHSLASMGDVDGDLHDDYLVGAPGFNGIGRVWCYSGRTGEELWFHGTTGTGYGIGFSAARVGDVNGDGIAEAIIGAPTYLNSTGFVRLLNGADGAVLWTIIGSYGAGAEFGYSVGASIDASGDGIPDVIVGAPGAAPGGAARILSGANGALLHALTSSATGARFGHAVGGGADIGSDGLGDFIVGAPNYDTLTGTDAGYAATYSGSSGALIVSRVGALSYDYFGRSVAIIPGINGNAKGYTVIGASDFGSVFGTGGGNGYVHVYRNVTALGTTTPWAVWTGDAPGDRFGQSVASAGDINEDGYTDVVIGAVQGGIGASPSTGPGYVQIRSGRDGSVLWQKSGAVVGENYGWTVAGIGDTGRDGTNDILVGAPFRDVGCVDAGRYQVLHPPVPPSLDKVMITEVTSFAPQGVEITNFGATVSLNGYRLRWLAGGSIFGGPLEATLSGSLAAGASMIVTEPGATYPEAPPGTPTLQAFPAIPNTTNFVIVALENSAGQVVDEVRIAGTNNTDPERTLGGRFRGFVRNVQPGPIVGPVHAERIWGLDSNGGADWTSRGTRSFGLENASSGTPGFDPLPLRKVVINEVDDLPDYVELRSVASGLFGVAADLEGWTLHASGLQNSAHARLKITDGPYTLGIGDFFVLGDVPLPPLEIPSGVGYSNLANVPGGGNLPMDGAEYSLALHDEHGRLIDVVRTTGNDDNVVHNHPRALSRWRDFQGAARRDAIGAGVIGRNAVSSDTDTASDWRPYPTRTMGSANSNGPFVAYPTGDPGLDVRLNSTALGGGLTVILNAGEDHAGQAWSFLFDIGHFQGQGPVFGLGPNALNNYLWTTTTPPFFGVLDARGSARLDFPSGSLPSGVGMDAIFLLIDQNSVVREYTPILEFDS